MSLASNFVQEHDKITRKEDLTILEKLADLVDSSTWMLKFKFSDGSVLKARWSDQISGFLLEILEL